MSSERPVPCITALADVAADVAAEAAMYQVMVESTIDVIIHFSIGRNCSYVSPACREVFGYEPDEMLGVNVDTMIHPDDFPNVQQRCVAFGPDVRTLTLTFRAKQKGGDYVWIEGHYRYLPQDGTSVAVMRDVTARQSAEIMLQDANSKLEAANDILRTLAQQDGLTGLANRRHFDEMLDQEYRRAARQQTSLTVLLIDVDSFKPYNDRYGHLAGDDCLRRISQTIDGQIRRPGDHAARYGGEEFIVLLPNTELTGAMMVAENIRVAVVAQAIEHLDSPFGVVTISIGGGAVIPQFDDTAAQLVEASDRALYRAKSEGRNRVRGSEANAFVTAC